MGFYTKAPSGSSRPRAGDSSRARDTWLHPGSARSLLERVAGSGRSFVYVFLVSFALFVPGLLLPAFQRAYIDFYLLESQERWLTPLLGLMSAAALFAGVLQWLLDDGLTRLHTKLQTLWSSQMMWRMLRLPMDYFTRRAPGDVAQRVNSNARLAWLVAGELTGLVFGLAAILVYALVMWQVDPFLTVIGVSFAAANGTAFLMLSRRLRDGNRRLEKDRGRLAGLLARALRAIDAHQASGNEAVIYAGLMRHEARITNRRQELGIARVVWLALPLLFGLLGSAAVLVVGGARIMEGSLTIGLLAAFQALLLAFSQPVDRVVAASAEFHQAEGLLERMDDVLRQPEAVEFHHGAPRQEPSPISPRRSAGAEDPPHKLGGQLELRGVSFAFSTAGRPFINHVDLTVEPGRRVALVGPSGSGKSTLALLVAGLYEPWTGTVSIDGRRLADIPRHMLRNSVAVVDQEVALFAGTVADNLTMWDSTVPEERLVRASKDACLHEVIAVRPGGYRHFVEEDGRNFSGGERQRMEIARALIKEPSVLILDEATSSLDAETERRVVANLRRCGASTLMIAHRLATVRDCDEILRIEDGRIVERGTHVQLTARSPRYRELMGT